MSKKVIIEKNCVRTRRALCSYFVSVLDFYLAMGKDQAGKSHNYPSHRKPDSSGRKGICGRKKKKMTMLLPLTRQHTLICSFRSKEKKVG